MKATKIIAAGVALSTLAFSSTTAAAVGFNEADSHATIEFKKHMQPTSPKDPENPAKPVDPTDPNKPTITNQNGPLSLDVVPNYDFGEHEVDLAGDTYDAGTNKLQNYMQVSDNRTDRNGWTITVKRSAFVDSSKRNKLAGATLTIPAGTIRNEIPTADQQNTGGSDRKVSSDAIVSVKVALADDLEEIIYGTKVDSDTIGKATTTSFLGETQDTQGNTTVTPATLTIPAGVAKEGNYTATMTWSTTAGVFN